MPFVHFEWGVLRHRGWHTLTFHDEGVARACLFRSARCACPVTSTVTAASAMKTFLGTEFKNKVTSIFEPWFVIVTIIRDYVLRTMDWLRELNFPRRCLKKLIRENLHSSFAYRRREVRNTSSAIHLAYTYTKMGTDKKGKKYKGIEALRNVARGVSDVTRKKVSWGKWRAPYCETR